MRKKLCILLVLLLLGSSLVSCSGSSDSKEITPSNPTNDTTSAENETETTNIYDEAAAALPTEKYADKTFTILTREEVSFEIDAESETGEITNDAVYSRNMKIEDTYGIKIATVSVGNWDDVTNSLEASINAGDHTYDLAGQVDFKVYAVVGKQLCGNWLDLPHVDLSREWWANLVNDAATINGKLYTAAGDIGITSILYTDCLFYNADFAEASGITVESLQNAVFDKQWTLDYFYNLVANFYTDTNGDGVKDAGDVYGFAVSPGNNTDGWLTAFDQPIANVDKDGKIAISLLSDKTISALEKLNRLHWEEQGVYNPGAWDFTMPELVASRHALFTTGIFNDARTSFSGMEDDFGILPFPMWDEAQGTYYAGANDQFTVLVFPIDTQESDYEYLGTITEALAIESARTVRPAFYNSALKNRYSMDANTAQIIDIIMDGRRFDFSFQYGNDILVPYMFRNQIIAQSNDIVSTYEKSQKAIETKLSAIACYYGLE